jgi:hypothetical protein
MEGLGRVFNVVPIAAGKYISMVDCSAITFVCTGADTFTLSEAKSSGGLSAQAPGTIIKDYYTNTATDGTAKWIKHTLASGSFVNAITAASGAVVFDVFDPQLDDGFTYVAVTVGGSGLVQAIVHDLNVGRGPANLKALVS